MAVSTDSYTQASQNASSPLTFSHTCSGSNRLILVGIQCAGTPVTGVSYGGEALTELVTNTVLGDDFTIWAKVGPLSGSNTVSITYSGSTIVRAIAASYSGVKQSGLPDATAQNSATSGTSISQSITVVDPLSWVLAFSFADGGSIDVSTGLTSRLKEGGSVRYMWSDSNGSTGSGSYATTVIFSSSTEVSHLLVSVAPSPLIATTNHLKYYRRTRFPGDITGV